MLPQEIIRNKRNGQALSREEIDFFIRGLSDGSISSEQISALAMAIYFNSMEFEEIGYLTRAMVASGHTIDWTDCALDGPVLDKHSTGGVGDKVSLMLAPIVAACGGYVPMISGRGLGHGGGTLDKLDSIPGYNTSPDLPQFKQVVKSVGCAIIGQTKELAPADKRFYGIRDVTATVESIPLITASILSKKVSAGLEALSMDVKMGNGAFMQTMEDAEALTASIVNTAAEIGLPASAIISDMSEVLGPTAGNAVEVKETVDYLLGSHRDPRLHEVVIALAVDMICMGGLAENREDAKSKANAVLDDGRATEVFAKMVAELGGPADFVEQADKYLPAAAVIKPVFATESGLVNSIDVRKVGNSILDLGGGRKRADQEIDHAVGLTDVAGIGAQIDSETPLALVHAKTEQDAEQAANLVRQAFTISSDEPAKSPVIYKTFQASK